MAIAKSSRSKKAMLGQFMTPGILARDVFAAAALDLTSSSRILEPSFGEGVFLFEVIEALILVNGGVRDADTLEHIFSEQLFGAEIDTELFNQTFLELEKRYGKIEKHNFFNVDFFKSEFKEGFFDVVIGNPPYGGSFDSSIEDALDKRFGWYKGVKIKKETYSFFIVKSLRLLKKLGRVVFITSDTFLSINTMAGLRLLLMESGEISIYKLNYFSEETAQDCLVLDFCLGKDNESVVVNKVGVPKSLIMKSGNFSFSMTQALSEYFSGKTVGDFLVATSGMTVGKNEFFLKDIVEGRIVEEFEYSFFMKKVSLEDSLQRARLGKISDRQREKILDEIKAGAEFLSLRVNRLASPQTVTLPDPSYRYYNKARPEIVYTEPKTCVYWKDEGAAVLAFKKSGPWYLNGVGGAKFFGREGMTWQLVASRLNTRYLPKGYILDSGAPCAFLREGVSEDEFWFIFGWSLTELASRILKGVINHTRNIQGKDFERMPYPDWVEESDKARVVALMKDLVTRGVAGERFDRESVEIGWLESLFKKEVACEPSV